MTDTEKAASALHHLSPTMPREDWFRVCAAARAGGIDFDAFDQWSAGGQSYNPKDVRDTWNSLPPQDGGIGAGTLYAMAKREGWQPPKAGAGARVKPPTPPAPRPAPPPPQPQDPAKAPAAVWSRCIPATHQHDYIAAKQAGGVPLERLRMVPPGDPLHIAGEPMAGALVLPLFTQDGTLTSLQFIPPKATRDRLKAAKKRDKLNLPGAQMGDGFLVVGELVQGKPAYVCEGVGQAWTSWQVTGLPAVVAFGWGRVERAAKMAQATGAQVVLVPDSGKQQDAAKMAQALGVSYVDLPDDLPSNTDVNDIAQRDGLDAVKALLLGAKEPPPKLAQDADADDDVDGADAPHLSEIELAERFSALCTNQFRWTPGMDWMTNAGTHWERDDHLRRFSVVKSVCRGAATEVEKPGLAAKLCSASTASAVLSLARSESSIVTPVSEWDKYPMLLNTPGDAFDLETGLAVSRDGLLFTQVTGAIPGRMATPVWDKFVSEVFASDLEMVEFIQRLAGYCLTGSVKEQKIFFFHGEGANGKSVLLEVLRAITGRYAHNLPSEALMTAKHERHPTTFAALQGKRLAISSEIEESSHWAEARIKSLTGDATMTARFMRGDEFTFNVTHKHLLAGNFKPRLKGDDHAMVRRMVLVPFTQRFTGTRCDDRLPDKLKAEYPGILAWAIEGARKWAADGLRIPGAVADSSKEYMNEQNDIELWAGECCNVGDGLQCKSSDLYVSYAAWKVRNGENAGSSKVFSQRLERKFTKSKSNGLMVFKGLQLKPEHQQGDYQRQSRGY